MSSKWVVNASPLILLAKIGQIPLLPLLADELIIPASVAEEIQSGPTNDPARQWLRVEGKGLIRPDPTAVPSIAAWDLGAGETAVLSWAFLHKDFEGIFDDRAARKCAKIQGILFRGTLGVILAAKTRGLIPAARPLCDDLVRAGLHIETGILQAALGLVQE